MLGELLMEESGKVIGQRVLPVEGGGPRIEVTFEANGKLLGNDAYDRGTYVAELKPDGHIYAQGQGLVITPQGSLTWKGWGVGRMNTNAAAIGGYTMSYRGAIYYETGSPALARMNGVCAVFEFDVDGENNTKARAWEWK